MGLKNILGQGMQYAAQAAHNKSEEIKKQRERYENYDDERLIKAFQQSSGTKRLAIAMILKERGYNFK